LQPSYSSSTVVAPPARLARARIVARDVLSYESQCKPNFYFGFIVLKRPGKKANDSNAEVNVPTSSTQAPTHTSAPPISSRNCSIFMCGFVYLYGEGRVVECPVGLGRSGSVRDVCVRTNLLMSEREEAIVQDIPELNCRSTRTNTQNHQPQIHVECKTRILKHIHHFLHLYCLL
jgi:hypothetical protein